MSYKKGAHAERKLIEMLRSQGYVCVRVAGSGRARFEQPDIIASNRKRLLSIECKHISANSVYISKEEVHALKEFSKKFGAEPIIAVRFKKKWEFWRIVNLEGTKNQYYCFRKGEGKEFI